MALLKFENRIHFERLVLSIYLSGVVYVLPRAYSFSLYAMLHSCVLSDCPPPYSTSMLNLILFQVTFQSEVDLNIFPLPRFKGLPLSMSNASKIIIWKAQGVPQ